GQSSRSAFFLTNGEQPKTQSKELCREPTSTLRNVHGKIAAAQTNCGNGIEDHYARLWPSQTWDVNKDILRIEITVDLAHDTRAKALFHTSVVFTPFKQ